MSADRGAYALGPTLLLRAPERTDIVEGWRRWFSGAEDSRRLWVHFWPYSRSRAVRYHRELEAGGDRLVTAIARRRDGRTVGLGKLDRINWPHRFAEITVALDASARRGPAALEAYGLVLEAAFSRLNLETVIGQYAADHAAVAAIHRRLGFVPRGRIPGLLDLGGRRVDLVIAAARRRDWLASRHA